MKRIATILTVMFFVVLKTVAMSYSRAQQEALFLTDKMAYELNLTDEQYEAAYEINLDYLMSVAKAEDIYGSYWEIRNADLSYILLSWQWEAFCAASYFFRPIYWNAGLWHFAIYSIYPRRDFFYFHRPVAFATYRGGHSRPNNGGKSYYQPKSSSFQKETANHSGMRDSWNKGERKGLNNVAGGSTRVTVNKGLQNTTANFGGKRSTTTNKGENKTTTSVRSHTNNTPSSKVSNTGITKTTGTPSRTNSGITTSKNTTSSTKSTRNSTNTTPQRTSVLSRSGSGSMSKSSSLPSKSTSSVSRNASTLSSHSTNTTPQRTSVLSRSGSGSMSKSSSSPSKSTGKVHSSGASKGGGRR